MDPILRRRWQAFALSVLALGFVVAGVFVLAPGGPEASPVVVALPAPGAPLQLSAEVSAAPQVAGAVQQPGTVLLPDGGTAKLVREDITAQGVLPIPEGLGDAAWWGVELGAPKGASLLSGHVNWGGKTGPFNQLWSIRQGQEVSVVDTAGGRWQYRVSDILTLHKAALPARALSLFGPDGPPRLVLVTCGGEYVGGTDVYRDNRIVTADLVTRPR
jgi:hypothetical protein